MHSCFCCHLRRGVCFVLALLSLALWFPSSEASESLQSHPSYPWGSSRSPTDAGPLHPPPNDAISINPADGTAGPINTDPIIAKTEQVQVAPSRPLNERTGISTNESTEQSSSLTVTSFPTLTARRHPTLSKDATLVSLAFLAGISDYLCFKKLQFFVIMQTGNFLHALSSLVEGRWKEAINFGVIVSAYAIGSGIWRALHLALSSSSAVLVAVVLALPLFHRCDAHPFSAPLILSLAFGLISSAATAVGEGNISFAYTGHISNAGKYFVERVLLRGRSFKRTPGTSLRLLLGFASGVLSSALCHQSFSHLMVGEDRGRLSHFARHPFLVLGIAYAIVLCVGGVDLSSSSSQQEAPPTSKENSDALGAKNVGLEELISTKLKMRGVGKRRRRGDELDIRIDGWTNMHAGPRRFEDGS